MIIHAYTLRMTHIYYCLSALASTEETGTSERGIKPDASSHTEQEESHAALQLQEITSVLMTQVSGECLASAVDLKHTVHSVSAAAGLCKPCNMLQHGHTHSDTRLFI